MNNDRFKFRVWSDMEQMIYDVLPVTNRVYYTVDRKTCKVEEVWDEPTYMQCTGLTDKNGKLIYEGDIIAHPGGFSGDYYIKPDNCTVEFSIEHNESGFWINDLPDDIAWCDVEVIGNIHEGRAEG